MELALGGFTAQAVPLSASQVVHVSAQDDDFSFQFWIAPGDSRDEVGHIRFPALKLKGQSHEGPRRPHEVLALRLAGFADLFKAVLQVTADWL